MPWWPSRSGAPTEGMVAARKTSTGPSKSPHTTNAPAARNATSFTMDSSASAIIIPGWRSAGRTRRSPNRP